MQLTSVRLVVLLTVALATSTASADNELQTTTTLYHESGGPLDMTIVTPEVRASVDIVDELTIDAGWEADIVTGASVAVVDAPSPGVDVISSATQLDDARHTFGGGLTIRGEFTTLSASYAYGFENDYRSHGFSLGARAEMFERNTAFDLSYARGFDTVCTLNQPRNIDAVDRRRMPDAEGCFEDNDERADIDLSLQTFQGGWTQAWTPVFTTQLIVTAQVLDGFQGNPYRGVWLGRTAALENHPEERIRYAAGLRLRLWLKPLEGALQGFARVYRDTWDIKSFTGELAYEQEIPGGFRLRGRARFYAQSGAAFFSDDYTRMPRGQYFTGDRELSPMTSWTFGGRLYWEVPPNDEGYVLGFLDTLQIAGQFDFLTHDFTEYRYGQAAVPNTEAIIVTGSLQALF